VRACGPLREDVTVTAGRPARRAAAVATGYSGYSGTPLHRKLGVRPGSRVLVVDAPAGFPLDLLDAEGAADLLPGPAGPADVVLTFCPDTAALLAALPASMAATAERGGRCWIAWPKRASRIPTDLTEDGVRAAALAAGWVDVKVCAVDAVWSGLCLMRRTRSRGVEPAAGDQ
jgi:hypothetical protein